MCLCVCDCVCDYVGVHVYIYLLQVNSTILTAYGFRQQNFGVKQLSDAAVRELPNVKLELQRPIDSHSASESQLVGSSAASSSSEAKPVHSAAGSKELLHPIMAETTTLPDLEHLRHEELN